MTTLSHQNLPAQLGTIGSRERLLLAAIIFFGLLMRVAAIILFEHAPESDEAAYRSMATNLLHDGVIVDAIGYRAMWNVGYPLFVIAPVFALFGENDNWVRLANLLLGGVSIFLCHSVASAAGASVKGRLIASAVWALYLPASVYTVYLFKEHLTVPLVLGVVWCVYRLSVVQRPLRVALLCGALLGLLALAGNAALAITASVAVAVWRRSTSWVGRAWVGLTIAFTAALVAAPWMARNQLVFGVPLLNTNGGFNLYIGNNDAATGMFVSISETPRGATWDTLRSQGELQMTNALRDEAIQWIRQNPLRFTELAFMKAGLFWKPPLHGGKGAVSFAEKVVRIIWLVQYLALLIAAVGALVLFRRLSPSIWPLVLSIAIYAAVHSLFYVIFRYRESVMPLVGVLAAFTLNHLWNAVIKRTSPVWTVQS